MTSKTVSVLGTVSQLSYEIIKCKCTKVGHQMWDYSLKYFVECFLQV